MRQIKWGKVTFLNIYKQSKSINKQTNKQTKRKRNNNKKKHWQVVKTDIQQYGKMRGSL